MALVETFKRVLDSLPDDWTDLTLDLRIADEDRYVEAATYVTTTCNAQPYSRSEWHWRILVAHRFGHAAAPTAVESALSLLDQAGLDGELVVRDVRVGRAEVEPMWGRGETARAEFRRLRAH
ncbi:hypothetical protein [Patulibacter defluvii]|uniref:hypothetical protein n=1 Tax=Patulibacter defluvii TaxID=3095358 RepID=UPI002A762A4D|nr:hypothetical protein [Patulibacter sp. DM4]